MRAQGPGRIATIASCSTKQPIDNLVAIRGCGATAVDVLVRTTAESAPPGK